MGLGPVEPPFPLYGDFTFLNSPFLTESLRYDFLKIHKLQLFDYFRGQNSVSFIPPEFMYPKHTDKTRKDNLFAIEYIARYGWELFVLRIEYLRLLLKKNNNKSK
jgi:hypothetical protein